MAELEQFCILARSQKSRACAALIQQVISHKNIFVFGELLEVPSVKSLKDSEFNVDFNTLELFAYGTYNDYTSNRGSYLELTEVQLAKLKRLTLLSVAAKQKVIPFSVLQGELGIAPEDQRALEDLIIDTIYLGLLNGKLDQMNHTLRVKSVASRDVKFEDIDDLIATLNAWKDKFGALMTNLQSSSSHIAENKAAHRAQQQELQSQVNERRAHLKSSIEAGVDPADLEDIVVSHRSGGGGGGSGGSHKIGGGGGDRHMRSGGAGGGGGLAGSMKSMGKRMFGGGGGGAAAGGGMSSSSSRGPPGGGFKSGSRL